MCVVEVAVLVVLHRVEVFLTLVGARIDQMPLAIDLQSEEGHGSPVFVRKRLSREDDGVGILLQQMQRVAIVCVDIHVLPVPKQEVEFVVDRKACYELVEQRKTLLGRECPSEAVLLAIDFVEDLRG